MDKNEYDTFLDVLFDLVGTEEKYPESLIEGTKESLSKSFNEGYTAQKEDKTFDDNPYQELPETTYNAFIAWSEGWMSAYLENVTGD